MSLEKFATDHAGKNAIIMEGSGAATSFADLNERSRSIAALLRSSLEVGDRFSLLLENCPEYFELSWAARRAGLRWVPINWHLHSQEVSYIVENSDSRILVSSPKLADLAGEVAAKIAAIDSCFSTRETFGTFSAISGAIESLEDEQFEQSNEGMFMLYSSGTTGQPKGILRPLKNEPFGSYLPIERLMQHHYGFSETTVFYTPSPLYHAAPLGWAMGAQQLGATVVCTERFDAEETLATIDKYGVTHALFVPTHLARMLKLPEKIRNKYDCSSLKLVVHAAAPCPPAIKRGMIEWWGPIIHEFYGSSEGAGFTTIDAEAWLAHPGSIGRAMSGKPRILDSAGVELPNGEVGELCFEGVERFEYYKSPEKTRAFFDNHGLAHTGDLASIDDEGYIYLAGRSSGTIISGGVNIYPQEIESCIMQHPLVADVAAVGTPDQDLGEVVIAWIQLLTAVTDVDELTRQLKEHCLQNMAKYKCPRSFRYTEKLPRLPNGKLLRRYLDASIADSWQ